LVVLFLFIRRFLKPLFGIVELMRKVEKGDLTVRQEIDAHDEIGYLGSSFNRMLQHVGTMMERNTALVREVYEAKYLQKEAQYEALSGQIRPHFLNNTLNTVSLLIRSGETEKAVDNIGKLGFLLRGMSHMDREIPLSAEISFMEAYLGLQKSRFEGRLEFEVEISRNLESYRVPALLLQPLVENAVIHGCEGKRDATRIRIFDTVESESLVLHILDDGCGIPAERLERIRASLSSTTPLDDESDGSIGLLNVHRRIRNRFGDSYGLIVDSQAGGGTHVRVVLPLSASGGLKE